MTTPALIDLLLVLTVAAACVRLTLWWLRAPGAERSAPWRLALLLLAQPVSAWLLHQALVPRPSSGEAALVVAADGAPRLIVTGPGERLVSLPEAPAGSGGEPAPDLATALRRHPQATSVRVVGFGLGPRDRDAVAGVALTFERAPLPRGIVELRPPPPVAPGASFTATGRVDGEAGGSVELLDPAGRVIDASSPPASGAFELHGSARAPGPALFAVRVRDRAHAQTEIVDLPVWTTTDEAPRVLLLAGAPGPEVKALRRWAQDAGVDLRAAVAAGDGLELGDSRPALTATSLDKLDLVVVDERSWGALSASEREALGAAVRRGLGLLLRVTGPLPASVRGPWSAGGLPLAEGEATAPVRLLPAAKEGEAAPPELTRRVADVPSPGAPALIRDASGAVLGRWRAVGQGRVGAWTVTDSSGLVTSGFGDRYAELWSAMSAVLSRPIQATRPTIGPSPRAGRRTVVCGAPDGSTVSSPAGGSTDLLADTSSAPTTCAGYWPATGGWHVLHIAGPNALRRAQPFYVWPSEEAPGVSAQEDELATSALVTSEFRQGDGAHPNRVGPPWAWFLAWILATAALWVFERGLWGRSRAAIQATAPPLPG